MPLYIVLLVLIIALFGALLNPMALLLRTLPLDVSGLLEFITDTKMLVANFLLWVFFCLLVLMVVGVLKGRWAKRKLAVDREKPITQLGGEDQSTNPLKMVVAITAYNEAQAIAKVVEDFKRQPQVGEVIVVDNNSHDETAALAVSAGAKVVSEPKQGYGYACIRGLTDALALSNADVIVLTEGDGTFAAEDLAKFQAYIHQADMVVGTRTMPGLVETGSQMDSFFTWGNMFAGILLQLRFWEPQFLGLARLTDVGCTYRAIRREALQRILPDLLVGGHHFSPHMILVALARGLTVIEIPTTFRRRIGKSNGANQSFLKGLQVGLVMIWHILTYKPKTTLNHTLPRVDGHSSQFIERSL